ncbi:MAG: LPXTG cell wall anchor domain-containing protein [Glutamicibacter arilaitensis]
MANTGIDGFWTAGVGILLAIGGVVFIARSRKASAK